MIRHGTVCFYFFSSWNCSRLRSNAHSAFRSSAAGQEIVPIKSIVTHDWLWNSKLTAKLIAQNPGPKSVAPGDREWAVCRFVSERPPLGTLHCNPVVIQFHGRTGLCAPPSVTLTGQGNPTFTPQCREPMKWCCKQWLEVGGGGRDVFKCSFFVFLYLCDYVTLHIRILSTSFTPTSSPF